MKQPYKTDIAVLLLFLTAPKPSNKYSMRLRRQDLLVFSFIKTECAANAIALALRRAAK